MLRPGKALHHGDENKESRSWMRDGQRWCPQAVPMFAKGSEMQNEDADITVSKGCDEERMCDGIWRR